MSNKHNLRRVNQKLVSKGNIDGIELFQNSANEKIYYKDKDGALQELPNLTTVQSLIGAADTLGEVLFNGNTTEGTDIELSVNDGITFATTTYRLDHNSFGLGEISFVRSGSGLFVFGSSVTDYVAFQPNALQVCGATPKVALLDTGTNKSDFIAGSGPNANRTHTLQDADGTIAHLTDTTFQAVLANGNISNGTNIVMTDGDDIQVGSTTGTIIGQAANVKLGFYGATPIIQPTALTAADATATDGTIGTNDTITDNLRTRLNELETKLQALGFIA